MAFWRGLLIAAATTLVLAPAAYVYWLFSGEGELAVKPLWAELQTLEWSWREDRRRGPLLLRRYGRYEHAVLGIAGGGRPENCPCHPSDPPRSWVVLNEHSPSRSLRQMVRFERYDLPCPAVDRVQAEVPDTDEHVMAWLRSICQPAGRRQG